MDFLSIAYIKCLMLHQLKDKLSLIYCCLHLRTSKLIMDSRICMATVGSKQTCRLRDVILPRRFNTATAVSRSRTYYEPRIPNFSIPITCHFAPPTPKFPSFVVQIRRLVIIRYFNLNYK